MRFILLLLVSAAMASPALAQWTAVPLATNDTVRTIVPSGGFSDLYLVGDNGLVAHSDATRTVWTPESALTSVDLHSARRPASSQIWASGEAGVVRLKLIATWFERNVPNALERFVLYSRESGCQNALGSAGSLYQTCDSGQNWDTLSSGVGVSLNHGAGFITGTSWIVGDDGTILHSTDGSQTWTPQQSGTARDLHHILEAGGGWKVVVGESGTILRSNDDGATWTPSLLPISTDLFSVDGSGQNGSFLLAVGERGMVLRSTDTGATWCQLDPGTDADLYGVEMVTNSEYIVAGEGGLMLRTTTGGGPCGAAADPAVVPLLPGRGGLLVAAALLALAYAGVRRHRRA